jgi:hypothetical protein
VSAPVAKVVAETMDNYLLMGHILTCKVIPKDEVHPELWVGANRKWRVVPMYRLAQAQHNKVSRFVCCLIPLSIVAILMTVTVGGHLQPRTEMQQRAAEKRLLSRQAARKRKLVEAGIVYNFDKVGYVSIPVRRGLIITQKTFCSHRKNLKAHHDNLCQPCMYLGITMVKGLHHVFHGHQTDRHSGYLLSPPISYNQLGELFVARSDL